MNEKSERPLSATERQIAGPYEARDWQCLLCRARVGNPPVPHDCAVEARIRQIVREELDARERAPVSGCRCPKIWAIAQGGAVGECILAAGHAGKCQLMSQSGVPYGVPGETG